MAVMPDGHAVTFDYDRTCSPEDFKGMIERILENTSIYEGLPQYKHIVELGSDADLGKLEKISDILAVLATVEGIATANQKAIEACRMALWKSETKNQRQSAINALKNALRVAGGGRRTPRRKGLPRLY
jgi:hypothetical protein